MRTSYRRAFVASACVIATLLAAGPASADDMFSGVGFGGDMGMLSPMDASSLMGDGLALTDSGGLFSTFDMGQHNAESYDIVADLSSDSALAVDQADIAKQAQDAADARRRASAAQSQVGPDGCPVSAPAGTLRGNAAAKGIYQICADSVAQAATPAAAGAIKFALRNLGAPYACGGAGRLEPNRFDCSSLVARAYHEGAGLPSAGSGWSPSTREMVPWDGSRLASWLTAVDTADVRPGDLVLYDTGGSAYRHVVMVLSDNLQVHTNSCGDVAHITTFWGYDSRFLVARRAVSQ